jgi:hypothetical protein
MSVPSSHTWVNIAAENNETSVLWRCSVCLEEIRFNRTGDPWASETEYPEQIDGYIGECPGPPAQATITRRAFFDRVSDMELSMVLNCACETMPQQCLKAKMWKLQVDTTADPSFAIVPADVQSLVDHMVECGMIDQARATEILTW